MSTEQPPDSDSTSSKAAERLAIIVDAAERAALKVIDDAEQEAQRYLDEAKVRADRIAAERLREAADQIERNAGSSLAAPRLRPVEPPREETPVPSLQKPAEPEQDLKEETAPKEPPRVIEEAPPPTPPPAPTGSAAARLLATQMAVSGSSRKEIESRLRNGFKIADTSEILDAILGPEEKADA